MNRLARSVVLTMAGTVRPMRQAFLIALLSIASLAQTQSPPEQSITGRAVLDDGQPAAGASIAAYPLGARGKMYSAFCDETGNFKLEGLARGSYSLDAGVPGFVLDNRSVAGNVYRAGENVTLRLVRGGVITGRVTDVAGEPLVGVGINLYRVRDLEGNRAPRDGQDQETRTDDRGIYRAFGLGPGAYIIGVEVDSGGGLGGRDVPTWYPSTTRDAATEVTVQAGQEVPNIDIRHRGVAGYAISGMVSGETDSSSPFGGAGVTLFDAATKAPTAFVSANESKSFILTGLSDGEYEICAQLYSQDEVGAASLLSHVTIKGADVTGINLKLVGLSSLAGRIAIERETSNTASRCENKNTVEEILIRARSEGRNPRSVNLLLAESDWRVNRIAPDAKGEFTLKRLEAGSYRLEFDLPGDNLYVRSITQPAAASAGGTARKADAARAPISLKSGEKLNGIEVTLGEGAASLNGRVVAARENQKLSPHLRVHLVPAEPTAADDVLRYAETMAGKNGAFAFRYLAPGKYWLLARSLSDADANNETVRPAAFDAVARVKLRREAEAAKNEIALQPCQRAKDATVPAEALKQ